MMFNSDALMVGLVFFLLFGAVSLYLYMYLQQVDQKVNLLESILLDMKVSNEIKSFDVPASDIESGYAPFTDNTVVDIPVSEELAPFIDESVEELSPVEEETEQHVPLVQQAEEPTLNYETATLKELQALAKAKGISVSNMKKSQVIEALSNPAINLQDYHRFLKPVHLLAMTSNFTLSIGKWSTLLQTHLLTILVQIYSVLLHFAQVIVQGMQQLPSQLKKYVPLVTIATPPLTQPLRMVVW
jgi:hypothetical protein